MSKKKVVRIRLDLEGLIAKRFDLIRKNRGLENNTEVMRLLITEEWKRLRGK